MPTPKLVITTPDGRRATLPLARKPVKLGRADWCDFVLRNDAEVSREHAEVWLSDDGRVVVADMLSKNGTRVDEGEAFKGGRRYAFRTIRIGEHHIQVVDGPPAPPGVGTVEFAPDSGSTLSDTQFFPSSRRLDLNQQRLGLLIQLSERIGGVFDRKQLLEQALDACCGALKFDRGLIALKTQRGDTELPVTRNIDRDETGAFRVSRSLINRALVDGERAIVNNPATDLATISESIARFPICSALCVPILNRSEVLGVIYGDRVTQATTYQPEDVDFLAAIAQQVGVGLVNLRLLQEHVRAERVYAELDQARLIQRRLLPSAPLELGCLRAEGYNEPSSAVSGDYYDYFDLEDGRAGIIIGDVTGHGLPAALVMANLQSAVRVALQGDVSLTELARRVNHLICRNTDAHVFVTAILGIVDTRSGVLEYVSAGHPAPLVVSRGAARVVSDERNSLPLGIEPDESFEVQRIEPVRDRAAVLLYTDGLTEAADPSGRLLGLGTLIDTLTTLPTLTPENVIQAARKAVGRHLGDLPLADDMTMLALQFRN